VTRARYTGYARSQGATPGVTLQGLETFNIVLVGTNFNTQRVQLEDFDFGGILPEVQFRLPQLLQVTAAEYLLQVIPGRFEISARASQPSSQHFETLKRIASTFIDEYTSKRSIIAVGHNFIGNFKPSLGSASDFMKYIAWRDDFAAIMGADPNPVLSLTARTQTGDEQYRAIRLEPLTQDNARLFYDLNFNWGQAEKPLQTPATEVLDALPESAKIGTELIDRIVMLGSDTTRS
jgi:hypothetical protein